MLDQVVVGVRYPGSDRIDGHAIEGKGLTGGRAVPVNGHDNNSGRGGSVGVFVGGHRNSAGRHGRGPHAVKARPHKFTVIADDHEPLGHRIT